MFWASIHKGKKEHSVCGHKTYELPIPVSPQEPWMSPTENVHADINDVNKEVVNAKHEPNRSFLQPPFQNI
jgi:hypothetical protein